MEKLKTKKMKWYEIVAKILTLGIYHKGKLKKKKKKWSKKGIIRKEVEYEYNGEGGLENGESERNEN